MTIFSQTGFLIFPFALIACLLYLAYRERRDHRRVTLERNLPRDHRLPRHYRSFGEIENRLWVAMDASGPINDWQSAKLRLPPSEVRLVRDYVRGLWEDFDRGNRVYSAVICRAPEMSILAPLEWQRLRIQVAFRLWYFVITIRLRMRSVSMTELRRLTDIIATLAYHVRTMLATFERSGNIDLVDSILKSV
jgi:hypothetical protein